MDELVRHELRRALLIQGTWTVAYVAVLVAALAAVFSFPGLGAWRTPIILLPMIPAFGILRFAMRQFQRGDEMQRRHQLIAAAWALGIVLVLMISYALLEAIGWPRLPMWGILCVTQAIWIACIWTQVLRFR